MMLSEWELLAPRVSPLQQPVPMLMPFTRADTLPPEFQVTRLLYKEPQSMKTESHSAPQLPLTSAQRSGALLPDRPPCPWARDQQWGQGANPRGLSLAKLAVNVSDCVSSLPVSGAALPAPFAGSSETASIQDRAACWK